MPMIVDMNAELEKLVFLAGRTRETPVEEEDAAFARLGSYRDGEMFVGGFSGASPWERHRGGDEFVHILEGSATFTIMMESGPEALELKAGMLIVVPRDHWHRFDSEEGVTVMTITPEPTDHTAAEDPRTAG